MKFRELLTAAARGAILTLLLDAFGKSTQAQGIIVVTPSQPINYGPAPTSQGIDITGSGIPDFMLICDGAFGSFLYPQGSNSLIIVPQPGEVNMAVGANLVAALSPGDIIGSNVSSLDPIFQWFNPLTNNIGNSCLADQNTSGQLGYFFSKSAYVGFDLVQNGQNFYGWMEVQNPFNVAAGSIVAWAYETSPNTTIMAGITPEPTGLDMLALGAGLWKFRRKTLR